MRISTLILSFILGCQALSAQGLGGPGFPSSVYQILDPQDAHRLYYSLRYLTSESGESFHEDALRKAEMLKEFLGTRVPVGPRPDSSVAMGDFMREKRDSFFSRFDEDKSVISEELSTAARSLSELGCESAAAHVFDLSLTLNPKDFDAAYEREKLLIEGEISVSWDIRNGGDFSDGNEEEFMYSPAGNVYTVNFSSLTAGGSSGPTINGLARTQALVKGLLVQELSGSQFAGSASQMNATVIGQNQGGELEVRFNQKVGSTMSEALDKMKSYLEKRHEDLPEGIEVELSFEEQYIPKDGPSAGVACTLMMESLIKGYEYSPVFAVTGAMNASGVVEGVGGIDGKIRGALSRNCELVAIPTDNEKVIRDMLILEDGSTLANIQIIGIGTFDDALRIAKNESLLEPDVRGALETFREVQGVLVRPGGLSYLRNSKVQAKLREVIGVLPDHWSAKYLLLKGLGQVPEQLTLGGSLLAIDRNAAPLLHAIREGGFDIEDKLAKDSFAETISALKRVRPHLDTRTRPCADAIIDYSGYVRTAINNPPRSPSAINTLVRNLKTSGANVEREYDNLFERPDVKDELMIEDD